MFLPSDYKGGRFLFNLIKCRKNRKKLSKKVFLRFFAYFNSASKENERILQGGKWAKRTKMKANCNPNLSKK